MKEKGFTLIELLAVIVILAIIALIAVPIIIDIIEDSKKESLKRSTENYLKAVELAIAKENLTSEFNPNSCTIESGVTKCDGKELNVTVDGEIPDSGEIKLSNGTIIRDSQTFLTYNDKDTLTYDSNGKLTIESAKEELIAKGVKITETTSGVAVNVDNQLVYYVPEGSTEATVYGYKGNINYSNANSDMGFLMNVAQTNGNIEIASKVKINGVLYDVTSIGGQAFSGMMSGDTNITSVTIPSSITSIGNWAFRNCSNLSNITIPSSVKNIGGSAFYGTPWLETKSQESSNGLVIINNILLDATTAAGDVVIPDGVIIIGDSAFFSNINITSVTIPEGVTSIGTSAFSGCTNLSSIEIPSTMTSIAEDAFFNSSNLITININKPNGSISDAPWCAYSATVNWLG